MKAEHFRIGDFARIAQVSIRLLRYYDEIGLFRPATIDSQTGYRSYTLQQLPQLHRILALKDLGLPLQIIERLLDEDLPPAEIRGMLRLAQAQLEQEFEAVQSRLHRVAERLTLLERLGEFPDHQVVLKSAPALHALVLHEDLMPPRPVRALFHESWPFLQTPNVRPHVRELMTRYYKRYMVQEKLAEAGPPHPVEAVYVVDDSYQGDLPLPDGRTLTLTELAPIDLMATMIHQGEDEVRHLAFQSVFAWIAANGYELAAPAQEVYLHRSRRAPQCNVTEIQVPIRRKPGP